jgi:hypothetical protein
MRHPPAGRTTGVPHYRSMQHSNNDGSRPPEGSTDESIGRPANWREGRYQRSGAPVDQPPRANRPKSPPAEQQKPVTLRDYEGK